MKTNLIAFAFVAFFTFTDAQRRGSKPPPPEPKQEKDAERLLHEKDFIAFDLNSDMFVDASEVRAKHKKISQEDVSAFFIAADKDEDGLVTLEEYVTVFSGKQE